MKEQVSRLARSAKKQKKIKTSVLTIQEWGVAVVTVLTGNGWNIDLGLETKRHHIASFVVGGDKSLTWKSSFMSQIYLATAKLMLVFYQGRGIKIVLKAGWVRIVYMWWFMWRKREAIEREQFDDSWPVINVETLCLIGCGWCYQRRKRG